MKKQKIWFITGAAKGFGLEITKAALAAGDKVVATVRNSPEILLSKMEYTTDLLVVTMDVNNENEVQAAVTAAIGNFGRIDVLVNNAGYGIIAAVEEASDSEVRKQFDTNVFGLLNVTRAVLPFMRKQRTGHIINLSSMGGYDALPGWGIYGASKFAVEGLSKALSLEVGPLGIGVTAVAPGVFRTEFLNKNAYVLSENEISDYAATAGAMKSSVDGWYGSQPGDPAKLAEVIITLANTENPPLHLPLGRDSVEMYKHNSARTLKEIDTWLDVATSTDF